MPEPELIRQMSNNRGAAGKLRRERQFFTKTVPDFLNSIDLWSSKPLYGKVNMVGEPVVPRLSRLDGRDDKNSALDFVLTAFNDMARRYTTLASQGRLRGGQAPARLSIGRGHASAMNEYKNYLFGFTESMATALSRSNFLTLGEFFKKFSVYLRELVRFQPVTLSGFILSPQCLPNTSGLVIEIAYGQHGDQRHAYSEYYLSENFDAYQRVALQHGFNIDVNSPWRLVADLGSPVMQNYMADFDTQFDRVFHTHYHTTYLNDMPLLEDLFRRVYPLALEKQPFVRRGGENFKRCESTVDIERRSWYTLYVRLRAAELGRNLSELQVANLVSKVSMIKELGIASGRSFLGLAAPIYLNKAL